MYTVSIATGLPCVQSDGELDDDFERGDKSELVGGDWRDDPGPQIEVVGGDVDEANAREEQLADATREESEILCTFESGMNAGVADPRGPDDSRFPAPYISSGTGKVGSDDGVIQLADYDEPGPRKFVVDGLIPEGFMTSLYGDGGTGKSYLALYLGFCVVLGHPFMNKTVEQGPVLYADAELDAEEQVRRAYEVARGLGLDKPPTRLYYLRLKDSLAKRQTVEALLDIKRKYGITLIILDSLTLGSFGIDPSQAKDEIGLLKSLESLGTILAVDHTRKPQPGEKLSDLRAFGSAFKGHFGRSQIHLLQHEAVLELRHTKANFSDKQDSIFAELHFDSDDESGSKAVSLRSVEPGDGRLTGANLPAIEKVFQAVAHFEDGAHIKQLAEVLDPMKEKTIRNHLSRLKGSGRIVQPEQGKWSLPADSRSPGYIYGKENGNPHGPQVGVIPDSQSYIENRNRESVRSGAEYRRLQRLADDAAMAYAANGLRHGAHHLWQVLRGAPKGLTQREIETLFSELALHRPSECQCRFYVEQALSSLREEGLVTMTGDAEATWLAILQ